MDRRTEPLHPARPAPGCITSYNARGPDAYIPSPFLKAPVVDGDSYRKLGGEPLLCWSPIDEDSVVRGDCQPDGWLELEGAPERYTQFLMSKDWYHTGEIPMFERELRADLARRLATATRELPEQEGAARGNLGRRMSARSSWSSFAKDRRTSFGVLPSLTDRTRSEGSTVGGHLINADRAR